MVDRGHEVTVYSRAGNHRRRHGQYKGMRVVTLPALRTKYTETLSHALLSVLHTLSGHYDIIYVCNSANAPICWIPLLRRQRVVLNVDGLEWQRAKWGRVAKAYYRWAASLAARMPMEIVTDADVIRAFYEETWGRRTRCIAYGTAVYRRGYESERVQALGLEPDRYLLYVSRMEPENNALLVVEAYRRVDTELPLVLVGDAPYAHEYIEQVRAAADDRVRFLGYRFGEDYHALQANARLYIQATEVGGTHPALVEALGHGNAIVAHDVPEHREVLGDAGRYFEYRDAGDLGIQIARLLNDPTELERLRSLADARVRERYTWDAVTDAYEEYFRELVGRV